MKLLLTLTLLACAAASTTNKGPRAVVPTDVIETTTIYSEWKERGTSHTFSDYVEDLSAFDMDNVMRSVCQTGLWFYYQNTDYNTQTWGSIYMLHGIEVCADLPVQYSDHMSSLRYAGSPYSLNEASFNLYEGQYFTGSEFWGNKDSANLRYLDDETSSVVITGADPWTLYSEPNYQGDSICVYPMTDHDIGPDGNRMDLGIYPNIEDLDFKDNTVSSVAQGCFSVNTAKPALQETLHEANNGAGQVFVMKKLP